ncbi:hypothetical protein E2I00_012597, partial [Balaenoptera physalus]
SFSPFQTTMEGKGAMDQVFGKLNMCTIAEYPAPGSVAAADCCLGAAGRRLVKIAVVGASGVGKTALVVRFLTKRFIGDYERNAVSLHGVLCRSIFHSSVVSRSVIYSSSVQLDQHIVEKAEVHENGLSCTEQLNRCIRWADAVVIVFSITDYKSYELTGPLHQHVQQLHPGTRLPVVVVANKADLLHIKQVDPQLGLQLASMLGCSFYEVSVSENDNDVYNAFHVLCKEVSHKQQPSGTPEKRRTSLIPRPKSPNMQDLKRRFKQALSAKVRTVTSV